MRFKKTRRIFMDAPFSNTTLAFSLRVKDQNEQLYKIRIDPQHIEDASATLLNSNTGQRRDITINFHPSMISTIFLGLMPTFCINCRLIIPDLHLSILPSLKDNSVLKNKIYLISSTNKGIFRIKLNLDNLFACSAKFISKDHWKKKLFQLILMD